MTGLIVLIVGALGGAAAWFLFCAFMTWVETGRFRRAVRRG